MVIDDRDEWLEADGRGGFASGTASGIRTRRYHALLLTAATPPTGRMVLVNGVDAFVDTAGGTFALSSQRYAPGVVQARRGSGSSESTPGRPGSTRRRTGRGSGTRSSCTRRAAGPS